MSDGVARERPHPHGDPLLRDGEADHHLGAVVAVVLRVAEPAELVVVRGLEVGGGRVEQDDVDLQVQQVRHREEDLALEWLVGLEEEVHRAVEDLGVAARVRPSRGSRRRASPTRARRAWRTAPGTGWRREQKSTRSMPGSSRRPFDAAVIASPTPQPLPERVEHVGAAEGTRAEEGELARRRGLEGLGGL